MALRSSNQVGDWPEITTHPEKTERPELSVGHVMVLANDVLENLYVIVFPHELIGFRRACFTLNIGSKLVFFGNYYQLGVLIDIHL